jgi:stearoyl-CoA desaturase (delta-9 desaturase)
MAAVQQRAMLLASRRAMRGWVSRAGKSFTRDIVEHLAMLHAPFPRPGGAPVSDPKDPGGPAQRTCMSNFDSAIRPSIGLEAKPTPTPQEAIESTKEALEKVRNSPRTKRLGSRLRTMVGWFDNTAKDYSPAELEETYAVDWFRLLPFLGLHLMCLGVIWVGWSGIAVAVAAGLYVVHMFAVTAFYHRYFSHRTYKTSRFMQFIFAVIGSSCVQRGPIWWAARHRHHHRHSDEEVDIHSPVRHGLYWSHFGWITSKRAYRYDAKAVPDLVKFPELRFIDRFDGLVPLLQAIGLYFLGVWLAGRGWNTSGWQMLIWGFFISTVVCSHATFTINSLTHMFGSKRYESKDESRNSLLLALLTFGEGWHNNHHYYPGAVRQGFYWWEIDPTYYGLWCMSKLGLIWDLNAVPEKVREAHHLEAAKR